MKSTICLLVLWLTAIVVSAQSDDQKAMEYYYNGVAMVFSKNYIAAVSSFTDAIRLDSGFLQAYENRGVARFYLEDNKGAISDYDRALSINPDDFNTYGRRGVAKFNLRDYSGAIADFDMAVMGNFENIRYYNMRGQAKYKLQDYDGAIADFTRVIKSLSTRRDQKGKAYFWRGMVRIETGQKENGCLDLRKSLKLGNEKAADLLDIYCFQNMF